MSPVYKFRLQTGKEQKMMKQGRLGYNSSNNRYGLLASDLWIDTGFHCGSKYLVEFVWRYQGSYIFDRSNKFGFFPGISLGYVISEEDLSLIHISLHSY